MSAFVYFKRKNITQNGFDEVSIVHAIENQVLSEEEEDRFADID